VRAGWERAQTYSEVLVPWRVQVSVSRASQARRIGSQAIVSRVSGIKTRRRRLGGTRQPSSRLVFALAKASRTWSRARKRKEKDPAPVRTGQVDALRVKVAHGRISRAPTRFCQAATRALVLLDRRAPGALMG